MARFKVQGHCATVLYRADDLHVVHVAHSTQISLVLYPNHLISTAGRAGQRGRPGGPAGGAQSPIHVWGSGRAGRRQARGGLVGNTRRGQRCPGRADQVSGNYMKDMMAATGARARHVSKR